MDSNSRCLWLCSIFNSNEHCIHTTSSNFPVAEVSCVCSDKAWCSLATANVNSVILPYAKILIFLWIGNYLILSGISIFGIDSPLPNSRDLWNLCSYVFCKGVYMTIVANHFGNAGFNAIAKSSLLESKYIINQGKHLSKWTARLQYCHFLYMGLFSLICHFFVIVSKCVYGL